MPQLTGAIDDFGLAAASLAGGLATRLAALRAVGLSQVMLDATDLADHPDGAEAAVAVVRASGLRVAGVQALHDFEGLEGRLHDHKVEVARSMLGLCSAVGARLLRVEAQALPHAGDDLGAVARDLRKLAMLAVPPGIRIAYGAQPAGRAVRDLPAACEVVLRADAPNLGLALDALHFLDADTPLDELELLDMHKLFLVQLADSMDAGAAAAGGRGQRLFPGEGVHRERLAELAARLDALGFRGDYVFEVRNDDHRRMPAADVARRALRAAQWLGEDVLRRSVPLGHLRLRRPGAA